MYELRDAFVIAMVMSSEAALMYLALSSFVRSSGISGIRYALLAFLLLGMGLGVYAYIAPAGSAVKSIFYFLDGVRFYLLLFFVFVAIMARGLFFVSGSSKSRIDELMKVLLRIILLATCFFWLLPESSAVSRAIRNLGVLEDRDALFALMVFCGLLIPAVVAALFEKYFLSKRNDQSVAISILLGYLFALKIIGLTGLRAGLKPVAMRFIIFISNAFHDIFHVFFVMFQLPDHPFLKMEVYQGILYFLSPLTHAVVASIVITAIVAAGLNAFLKRPDVEISSILREPDRRIAKANFLRSNARAMFIVVITILLVWGGLIYTERSEKNALLDPVPIPVVDDGEGFVIISMDTMLGDTIPSQMRKYSYSSEGNTIVFMTIRKADNALAIALDMCTVCQPKGYAQIDSFQILCKYCNTPIPVSTVGIPGGCNPIPITGYVIEDHLLRIPRDTLVEIYIKGMEGKR